MLKFLKNFNFNNCFNGCLECKVLTKLINNCCMVKDYEIRLHNCKESYSMYNITVEIVLLYSFCLIVVVLPH